MKKSAKKVYTTNKDKVIAYIRNRNSWVLFLVLATLGLLLISTFGSNLSEENKPKITMQDQVYINSHIDVGFDERFPHTLFLVIDAVGLRGNIFDTGQSQFSKICLKDINMSFRVFRDSFSSHIANDEIFDPNMDSNCLYRKDLVTVSPPKEDFNSTFFMFIQVDKSIFLPMESRLYYAYPFDRFSVESILTVNLLFFDAQGKIVETRQYEPTLEMRNYQQIWKLNNQNQFNQFLFQRPYFVQFLTFILLFFLFLIPILLPKIESQADAISIAIAVFLGNWGFRQILVPNESVGYNLLDIILVGEYTLVLISLLATVFVLNSQGKASKRRVKTELNEK